MSQSSSESARTVIASLHQGGPICTSLMDPQDLCPHGIWLLRILLLAHKLISLGWHVLQLPLTMSPVLLSCVSSLGFLNPTSWDPHTSSSEELPLGDIPTKKINFPHGNFFYPLPIAPIL